ncbi:MAG: pyruvate formate lyase family protein [bacterium]
MKHPFNLKRLDVYIDIIQEDNKKRHRLDGWFLAKEIQMKKLRDIEQSSTKHSPAMTQAILLEETVKKIPISIREGRIFAGTEDDAFARSYALINPSFKVDTFEGYCEEDAVYDDIKPNKAFPRSRIEKVKKFWANHPFSKVIDKVYEDAGWELREVVYFVERVTGHTIPRFDDVLKYGIEHVIEKCKTLPKAFGTKCKKNRNYYNAMTKAMEAVLRLAERYSNLAAKMAKKETNNTRKKELEMIAETCRKVPLKPAENLYEAFQSYIFCWQIMNLEQLPNPFAFSAGNLDRIMQSYYTKSKIPRELAVQITRHFLTFFEVGDRNWAISQNIMVGGLGKGQKDATNDMSSIIIDAFKQSPYSQPNLSVRVHPKSPLKLYEAISKGMFSFGMSSPSFFNDKMQYKMLKTKGVETQDLHKYGIAGCQEPLIPGLDSSNTTNTWLNLAKVLELSLTEGKSLIFGKQIGPSYKKLGINKFPEALDEIKKVFYKYLEYFIPRMIKAGNACTEALSLLPVPFASAFMGGIATGVDMRDITKRGTKYNGSGCLIHGLANVCDSFTTFRWIEKNGRDYGYDFKDIINAVKHNFKGYRELRSIILNKIPKYGQNASEPDNEARELQIKVSKLINSQKNSFRRNFASDFSTPSTNQLYGFWVGATPDGRLSRAPLAFGMDPSVGVSNRGLLARVLSAHKLKFKSMSGGAASSMSINPDRIRKMPISEQAQYLKKVIDVIFDFNKKNGNGLPYVYFNVYSPKELLDVARHPERYPNPVILRIHGQYVDARHLSPDILLNDVIPKLDPMSTSF